MIAISVVIPTYKRPDLLVRCLQALMQQRLEATRYEVIVVSDGPDSETRKQLLPYTTTGRVCFLEAAARKGPAAARNIGWKHARAPLIAFTDDDTIPDPEWLTDFLNVYQGEGLIAFTGRIRVPLSAKPTDYERNTAGLETAAFVTANCCCTRRALMEVNGFDERFSMAWREDSDLEFELRRRDIPVVRLDKAWIVHPVRSASWGVSMREQKKGMYNALLYKKHPQLYRQKIQPAPAWNYYLMVFFVLVMFTGLLTTWNMFDSFCLVGYLLLLGTFIWRRLRHASKAPRHVAEMVCTSVVIPFLSIYWQLYGAVRFKTVLL